MNIVRTSQGLKQKSIIALTQTTAKSKRQRIGQSGDSTAAPTAAAAASQQAAAASSEPKLYPSKNASAIQQCKRSIGVRGASKRPRPPGNSAKIDIAKATYCGHCRVLLSDYQQHLQTRRHATMLAQADGRPPPMAFCKVCGVEHLNNNDHIQTPAHKSQVQLRQLDPSRPGGCQLAASAAATAAAPIVARSLVDDNEDDDVPIKKLAKPAQIVSPAPPSMDVILAKCAQFQVAAESGKRRYMCSVHCEVS